MLRLLRLDRGVPRWLRNRGTLFLGSKNSNAALASQPLRSRRVQAIERHTPRRDRPDVAVADIAGPSVTDPDLVKEGDTYYLFSSGPGIEIRTSTDRIHWTAAGSVFPQAVPSWAAAAVPGATSIWAPDVSFFDGQYHLYYAVSTYGSQRSVIALATNTTLDPANPAYRWVDHGPVIASRPGDRFNAIDPNVLRRRLRKRLADVRLALGGHRAGSARSGHRVAPASKRHRGRSRVGVKFERWPRGPTV